MHLTKNQNHCFICRRSFVKIYFRNNVQYIDLDNFTKGQLIYKLCIRNNKCHQSNVYIGSCIIFTSYLLNYAYELAIVCISDCKL